MTSPAVSWSPYGVADILRQTPAGRVMFRQLLTAAHHKRLTFIKADLRYKQTNDANAPWGVSFTDPRAESWSSSFSYGFFWNRRIYLHCELTDFIAAWTLIHEGVHFLQVPRRNRSREESFRIEYEAHVREAEWLLQKPEWITLENLGPTIYRRYVEEARFYQRTGTGYRLNHDGIRAYIMSAYIHTASDPTYRYTQYAYEGPPIAEEPVSVWHAWANAGRHRKHHSA